MNTKVYNTTFPTDITCDGDYIEEKKLGFWGKDNIEQLQELGDKETPKCQDEEICEIIQKIGDLDKEPTAKYFGIGTIYSVISSSTKDELIEDCQNFDLDNVKLARKKTVLLEELQKVMQLEYDLKDSILEITNLEKENNKIKEKIGKELIQRYYGGKEK